jgi:hypothetical protein
LRTVATRRRRQPKRASTDHSDNAAFEVIVSSPRAAGHAASQPNCPQSAGIAANRPE